MAAMGSDLALDSSKDFLSMELEGMRVGTDACGCTDRVPMANCAFIIVSIFSAEWEARTPAKHETQEGSPEGLRRKDKV